ncbi:MAG: LytTR family DNA-binding domain-containing protein [Comamonas sp.]|jgi:two-component system response regulator AlgR|uniref:LytR/AlgR family response regulator transcription factor n=1 Tax=Comamonas sp. TaxID=34028 RepID=UPI002850D996|nr:LytTR family DNA-binding domain-containing protein [Comamonas sp.]MDR3067587.1 LytTR family DNA-binding domain-containing protein [Comamonas sp.]
MHILIVDDEALARARLRTLLGDCAHGPHHIQEACDGEQALQILRAAQPAPVQLVLLDIHMPGHNGLQLAASLAELTHPPAVVFVTAHASHALQAFELDAVDYLTKPVRLERLQQSLQKAERALSARSVVDNGPVLVIQERGGTLRLPLSEVRFLKAEQKYITVRTVQRNYILDGALADLETRHGEHLLRIHRNALVLRAALRGLEKYDDPQEGEGWRLRLQGVSELLPVSRRQLAAVRSELKDIGLAPTRMQPRPDC